MIEFLIEIAIIAPQVVFKYPGNLILHFLFGRDVDLDEDSFAAYAWGIGLWLMLAALAWIIILLIRQ
jgi:hypothetical protein